MSGMDAIFYLDTRICYVLSKFGIRKDCLHYSSVVQRFVNITARSIRIDSDTYNEKSNIKDHLVVWGSR